MAASDVLHLRDSQLSQGAGTWSAAAILLGEQRKGPQPQVSRGSHCPGDSHKQGRWQEHPTRVRGTRGQGWCAQGIRRQISLFRSRPGVPRLPLFHLLQNGDGRGQRGPATGSVRLSAAGVSRNARTRLSLLSPTSPARKHTADSSWPFHRRGSLRLRVWKSFAQG